MSPTPTLVVETSFDTPLVWFEVTFAHGALFDPPGQEGLHRHAGLWARRGAGSRERAALDAYFDALGASVDIAVGRDAISLSGVALARTLEAVIEGAAEILASPRWDEGEHAKLLRETPQLLDEVRDDDAALATRWFDYQCCPGHPYGRTALATLTSLANFTQAGAQACWQQAVTRGNAVVGFAGAIEAATAERLTTRLLAGVPSGPASILPTDRFTRPAGLRTILVDKTERSQAQLRLGHVVKAQPAEAAAPVAIVEAALGGMFTSRLMQELRVKRGWTYGAGCAFRRSRLSHWFEISMAVGLEVTEAAVQLTKEIVEEFAAQGPTEAEREHARAYLIGSLPFQRATARQRMQLALRDHLLGLPSDFGATLPARIKQATPDEVNQACATLLAPADLLTVAVATCDELSNPEALGPVTRVAPVDY